VTSETLPGRPEVRAILARAARAAGMPLSVHRSDNDGETLIAGWGQCSACAVVNALPEGRAACREDRESAAEKARRRGRPVRFVCHMGFGCMSLAPFREADWYLTLGPWCPAGADQSLEFDACRGLAALRGLSVPERFPGPLDDIHRAPAGVVDSIADWLAADLARLVQDEGTPVPREMVPDDGPAPTRAEGTVPEGGVGALLAAAALGGNQTRVREIVEGRLAEQVPAHRNRWDIQQLRVNALVYEALEILVKTGVPGEAAAALGLGAVGVPGDRAAFRRRLNDLCAKLVRLAARDGESAGQAGSRQYSELDRLLEGRIETPPTLGEVAGALGISPAAVTRRLQRHFGVSYTGYVAKLRIERAKELLRRTRLPLETVAVRIGISDNSNFRRLFRKFEGISPADYRKRHGKQT